MKFPRIPKGSKLLCIQNKGSEAVYICETIFEIALMMSYFKEHIRFAIAPKECFLEEKITNRKELFALMNSGKSKSEWGDNCEKVKALFGRDYPSFWMSTTAKIDQRFLENPKKKSTHDTSNETNKNCKGKRM